MRWFHYYWTVWWPCFLGDWNEEFWGETPWALGWPHRFRRSLAWTFFCDSSFCCWDLWKNQTCDRNVGGYTKNLVYVKVFGFHEQWHIWTKTKTRLSKPFRRSGCVPRILGIGGSWTPKVAEPVPTVAASRCPTSKTCRPKMNQWKTGFTLSTSHPFLFRVKFHQKTNETPHRNQNYHQRST